MATAWPRALFPVLALTLYDAGPKGTGLLYAALASGGAAAVLTAGWLQHARRLGVVVIGAVLTWSVAIAAAGVARAIQPALVCFFMAGYADCVSSICRSTINQSVTPDGLRGRMTAIYTLVINAGPRLGDLRAGLVAGVTSAQTALLSGGLLCVTGVFALAHAIPALASYDASSDQSTVAAEPAIDA
jgi:hypothetical protein